MLSHSTRGLDNSKNFSEVLHAGLAGDGGLFVPKFIPQLNQEILNQWRHLSYEELALEIISLFSGDCFSRAELSEIVNQSYSGFDHELKSPLIKLEDNHYFLELFHGPTLAFKDFAMQVIAKMFAKTLQEKNIKINIITATSGDTGSAAVEAFKGISNVNLYVLYPHERISQIQRKQMTTSNAKNVKVFAVQGTFDDCQLIVKELFADKSLVSDVNLSGVNSINWARIIAQAVYYFYAYFKTGNGQPLSFSVPTGNFGDIYAGYLAKKLGLPVDKLIVATNKNDILHRAISGGDYTQKKVEETNTPSMDIQIASNFERLLYDVKDCNSEVTKDVMSKIKNNTYQIDNSDLDEIKKNFTSEMLDENETIQMIKDINKEYKVVVDPHTAVGIGAAKKLGLEQNCVVLSTAHPCKFPKAIEDAISKTEELPDSLKYVYDREEKFEVISNDINKVKEYVINSI